MLNVANSSGTLKRVQLSLAIRMGYVINVTVKTLVPEDSGTGKLPHQSSVQRRQLDSAYLEYAGQKVPKPGFYFQRIN